VSWKAYAVRWTPASQRDLRRLDKALVRRIVDAVNKYAETGYGDVKRLQGVDYEWRLRVGEWRVFFTLNADVLVLHVLSRGAAYK
jgi:mRNA-degrading endonuclease RelE of RelBE toxin-antitoxin system